MARRIPRSLFDAAFHSLWRSSRRFVATGMRLTKKGRGKARHFTGGPPSHKGANCPKCRKRLTLLWDLNLDDAFIPGYVREGFAPADRLPFYICWQCVAASYRITSNDRMECFTSLAETLEKDETPFRDSPNELPRRAIAFEPIPSTIDALLSLEAVVGLDALDTLGRKAISEYYDAPINSTWDILFSQFGGQPIVYQGHQNTVCPNPRCPAFRLEHPYGEMEIPYLMKELAVIHHDHEPELAKHCFQLLYYICGICFSIRAEYRCS